MGDLEARVAALEDEKRKLLSSWQRERDENARKEEELAAYAARTQSMRSELSKVNLALEQAQGAESTSKVGRAPNAVQSTHARAAACSCAPGHRVGAQRAAARARIQRERTR